MERNTIVRESAILKRSLDSKENIKQELVKLIRSSSKEDSTAMIKILSKAYTLNMKDSEELKQANLVLQKNLGKKKFDIVKHIFDAIDSGDVDTLNVLVQRAKKTLSDIKALEVAEDIMIDLEQENKVVSEIHEAMALGNVDNLKRGLDRANKFDDFSTRNRFTYEKAKAVLGATKDCELALMARDRAIVNSAVASAKSAGAQEEGVIADCMELHSLLDTENIIVNSIKEKMFELNIDSKLALMDTDDLNKSSSDLNLSSAHAELSVKEVHLDDRLMALKKLIVAVPKNLSKNDAVLDATTKINRADKIEEILQTIESGIDTQDLDKLNVAIEQVLELGIFGREINQARILRDKLEKQREKINRMMAKINIVKLKMDSRNEIDNRDIEIVHDAWENAIENDGLNAKIKQVMEAKNLESRMKKQLVIQAELHAAHETQQFAKLKLAMDHANENDIDIEIASKVRQLVRNLDAKKRAQQMADFEKGVNDGDDNRITEEKMQEQREKKIQVARHSRYNFTNYPLIRPDDEFAKGAFLNKKRIIAEKLKYQTSIISRSILKLDKIRSKLAVKIHHSILGYCGDKSMSFPATLAQDILKKALENPELIDEVYIQLCKHLTKNSKQESVVKAWQLMTLCCGSFPPSIDFEYYLINFITSFINTFGLIGNYAKYSFRRLEGIINSGASGFVPSTTEISCYKERPPILATIELVDGTPLAVDLPITPDLNVNEVKKLCQHFLGLKEKRAQNEFGLFVVDLTENRKTDAALEAAKAFDDVKSARRNLNINVKTPKPLSDDDFLGSIVVMMTRLKHEYSFVYKRKLYFAEDDVTSSDDLLYRKLVYLQAQEEFLKGSLRPYKEDDIIKLSSICIATYEEPFPATIEDLIECDVLSYIPRHIRYDNTDREYAKQVISNSSGYANEPKEYLQDRFVDILKKQNKLYGCNYFHCERIESDQPEVMRLPGRLIIGVNSYGIHVMDQASRELLVTYHFNAINRWGGTSNLFSFSIARTDEADTNNHDIIVYDSDKFLDDSFAFDMHSLEHQDSKNIDKTSSRRLLRKQDSENSQVAGSFKVKRAKSIKLKKRNRKKLKESYELALQMSQAADLSSLLNDYVKALVKREKS